MVKIENITVNGKDFIRTYSDRGYMIKRDGVQYIEAIDPIGFERTYTETETSIENEVAEASNYEKIIDILTGNEGG